MTKQSESLTPAPTHRDDFSAAKLLLDFADTTWRMAVPVVIFAGLGIALDKKVGSQPWLTLLGLVIGFGFAVLLVRMQLQRAEKQDD